MINVKFLSKLPEAVWLRQLQNDNHIWGRCRFIFDKNCNHYDWLVVYDDTPPANRERFSSFQEKLKCPREHTLLVTQEPHTIKLYGDSYTHQFANVLTSQTEHELPHPGRIYSQPALLWFYGMGKTKSRNFASIASGHLTAKQHDVSVVWSAKRQRHTTLYQRYRFLNQLKQDVDNIAIFGSDHVPLDDKAEALDSFRYHIAIENHVSKHHWTEKISDAFLGGCLPFYHGCPNISDYFPEQSYIPINIFEIDKSINIIKKAIASKEYEQRIDFIEHSRQKVLYEYNLFAVISGIVDKLHVDGRASVDHVICSRRSANRKNTGAFLNHQFKKNLYRLKYSVKHLLS